MQQDGAETPLIRSVMRALVAVGESVGVGVVEQSVVSISPGIFLEGDMIFGVNDIERVRVYSSVNEYLSLGP